MARGRKAETPMEIPAPGWKDILLRVKDEIAADHVSLVAAGVAFYALLAIFPAVTALMALAGLVMEPAQVTAQLESLTNLIPEEAANIILDQAVAVTGSEETGLGWAFLIGLALALYSASKGVGSLMEGLNVAYDEDETRGFVSKLIWTLGLTLMLIGVLLLGLAATLAVPAVVAFLALPDWVETLLTYGSWVLLAALTALALAVLYRYGPARDDAEWKWLTPGSIIACILWIVASVGFSIYVSNFGSYNESFGSMAGAIILLMWLWISAFIVLLGAEFNSEMEAQTRKDSTTGPDEPMGQRDAVKADKLGRAKGK
ncbi:YihY/virulence factor BrkB family protein [Sulfitobacter sp. R18_1]|uniref:YihY/virulence factor BrkB family protein n=1 Tax=Sulfitobacter sp. R18_1 TaxID=2821104 RepID=UPI001AD99697|nr:YihY/virulence factor BrkB family protein [Sulfitobacter sp. R18_1]MBO9431249.1 YihY/virulence factor BrkB family protein [Sulfitobacter sp. R18_1]